MYSQKQLDKTVLNGTSILPQKFPGNITLAPGTLTPGTVIQQKLLLLVNVAVNVALQTIDLLFYLDGVLYNDWRPTHTPLELFSQSPGLVGFTTTLVLGNDGFLYQTGQVITDPPALTEFLLTGNFDNMQDGALFGPVDITQLNNTGVGASRAPLPFDATVPHVFEVGFQNGVTGPANTAQILLSEVVVFQGMNGNTAAQ